MIKIIKDFTPWYLNPPLLIEIVPEIIKDTSQTKKDDGTKTKFKFGLEEIIYGSGILFLMYVIRLYV